MEATSFWLTFVPIYQNARRHSSEERNLNIHRRQNIEYYSAYILMIAFEEDSSVGITTGYGLDGRGLIPIRVRNFLYSSVSRPTLGTIHPPIQLVLGGLTGGKAAGT
jgi:hypothetical protein